MRFVSADKIAPDEIGRSIRLCAPCQGARPPHSADAARAAAGRNLPGYLSGAARLTNAFSKKVENLQAAVALRFAHYNLVRAHKSLRVTPAMVANVTDRLWSLEELVDRTSNEGGDNADDYRDALHL